jgi:tetratricopeptide (TPR) repeat protein
MLIRYLMVLFVIGLLSGCASTKPAPKTTTPTPITMTCSTLYSSQQTGGGKRIDLRNISVQLPNDDKRWCVSKLDRGQLILYSHPLMGQHIEKPEPSLALHLFGLTAMQIEHDYDQFESTIALQVFAETWMHRGMGVEGTGEKLKVMRQDAQNITVKRINIAPDTRPQANCVRYEYQMEERHSSLAPHSTLIQDTYGVICQHPQIPTNIVMMALMEQYPKGDQIDAGLFSQLKRDPAQAFFDSLEFTGTDDISKSTVAGDKVNAINLIPMYGYPEIQKTEDQIKADEKFINTFSDSRKKSSREFAARGWYYLQEGDEDTSMRRFNQSWLLDPDYYSPHWGFGVLLKLDDRAGEAVTHFDTALSLIDEQNKEKPRLLLDAADAYAIQGRLAKTNNKSTSDEYFHKANLLINEAILISPEFGAAYIFGAQIYYDQGNYKKAWELVKRSRNLNGSDIDSNFIEKLSREMPEPE